MLALTPTENLGINVMLMNEECSEDELVMCPWPVVRASARAPSQVIDWATFQADQARIDTNIHPQPHQAGGAVREGAALLCYKAWPCVKSVAADCTLTIAAETPHPATIARARISSRGWRVLSQRRRRANRSGRGGGFSPSCDARGWESNATCHTGTHKLGTLDPDTMRIREYTLPATGARPRRIALAPDGTVYYTDFARAYLGHFDPYG
jgi:hypothetical protein